MVNPGLYTTNKKNTSYHSEFEKIRERRKMEHALE